MNPGLSASQPPENKLAETVMETLQQQPWTVRGLARTVKALVWFWLIDETLSANLVYQCDYEIGSTTSSNKAIVKIMMMVMAW